MGTAKTLVLFQRTRFCEFAGMMVERRHRGEVICEPLRSYGEGVERMSRHPHGAPAMLIWGDGTNHHLSNVLNVPGSVKHVFDNHGDCLDSDRLACDSHNSHSRSEGVILRVCNSLGWRTGFFQYDEADGNGVLHVSVDLDFVKGFPALPWMSVGDNEYAGLLSHVRGLPGSPPLRFDIGGYHEMGNPGASEMAAIYASYYEGLIGAMVSALMRAPYTNLLCLLPQ